jgi:16S rRNA processing protein RimM
VPPDSFAGLTLARLLRPWGRHGEVAAEILTDFPERLAALRQAWLADGRNPPRAATILSCRLHGGQAVFQFAGVESIDEAEKLRGLELQVPLGDRASIPSGRYYISDLIGCAVWEENSGAALGTVREVQPLGAPGDATESWVLVVETPQGEVLIPLAAEICTRVDTAARRIDVRLPAGLRDLNK